MIFVGIDPGVTGALVYLSESSRILFAEPLPTMPYRRGRRQIDGAALLEKLQPLREPSVESFVTIEEVHAFHGQGITSAFSFGMTFGKILGVIETLGLAHQLVDPKRWQKELFSGAKGDAKKIARLIAHRLWPSHDVKHSGIVDALLIAEYGRRTWKGRTSTTGEGAAA